MTRHIPGFKNLTFRALLDLLIEKHLLALQEDGADEDEESSIGEGGHGGYE